MQHDFQHPAQHISDTLKFVYESGYWYLGTNLFWYYKVEIKSSPIFSKTCQQRSSFYLKSKKAKKSPNIWATFEIKFAPENFLQSCNLVSLAFEVYTHESAEEVLLVVAAVADEVEVHRDGVAEQGAVVHKVFAVLGHILQLFSWKLYNNQYR